MYAESELSPGKMSQNADQDDTDAAPSATSLLLESCFSITETTLSCHTLGLDSSQVTHDSVSSIQKELELADWLDRNILDYHAAMERSRHDAAAETTPTRQQVRIQQQELLDESVRQQQEQLLLSRIEMASIAQDTVFPQQSRSERDESEALLVQEAIQSRDELVTISLHKCQQLNGRRAQLQEVTAESQRLQDENRRLWQQLGSNTSNSNDTPADTTRLATETRILKRVLQDIIVTSDIDWYEDKRLRETMMKLETQSQHD